MSSSAASIAGFNNSAQLRQKRDEELQKLNEVVSQATQLAQRKQELTLSFELIQTKTATYQQLLSERKEAESNLQLSSEASLILQKKINLKLAVLTKISTLSETEAQPVAFSFDPGPSTQDLLAEIKQIQSQIKGAKQALQVIQTNIEQLGYDASQAPALVEENVKLDSQITHLEIVKANLQDSLKTLEEQIKHADHSEELAAINAALAEDQDIELPPKENKQEATSTLSKRRLEEDEESDDYTPMQIVNLEPPQETLVEIHKKSKKEKTEGKSSHQNTNPPANELITKLLHQLDEIQTLGKREDSLQVEKILEFKDEIKSHIHRRNLLKELDAISLLATLTINDGLLTDPDKGEKIRKNIKYFCRKLGSREISARYKNWHDLVCKIEKDMNNSSSAAALMGSLANSAPAPLPLPPSFPNYLPSPYPGFMQGSFFPPFPPPFLAPPMPGLPLPSMIDSPYQSFSPEIPRPVTREAAKVVFSRHDILKNELSAPSVKRIHQEIMAELRKHSVPVQSSLRDLKRAIFSLFSSHQQELALERYSLALQSYALYCCLNTVLKAPEFQKKGFQFFMDQPEFIIPVRAYNRLEVVFGEDKKDHALFNQTIYLGDINAFQRLIELCAQIIDPGQGFQSEYFLKIFTHINSMGYSIFNAIYQANSLEFINAFFSLLERSFPGLRFNDAHACDEFIRPILLRSHSILISHLFSINEEELRHAIRSNSKLSSSLINRSEEIIRHAIRFVHNLFEGRDNPEYQRYLNKVTDKGFTALGMVVSQGKKSQYEPELNAFYKRIAKLMIDSGASLDARYNNQSRQRIAELLPNSWKDLLNTNSNTASSSSSSTSEIRRELSEKKFDFNPLNIGSSSAPMRALISDSGSEPQPKQGSQAANAILHSPSPLPQNSLFTVSGKQASPTSRIPSPTREEKNERLQRSTGYVMASAFSYVMNSLDCEVDFLITLDYLEHFYTELATKAQANETSQTSLVKAWTQLSERFKIFRDQVLSASLSDPNPALIELFENHINDVIELAPSQYLQLFCELLKALAQAPLSASGKTPTITYKFAVLEVEMMMRSSGSNLSKDPQNETSKFQPISPSFVQNKFNKAHNAIETEIKLVGQPLNDHRNQFAELIHSMLDAANMDKGAGNISGYKAKIDLVAKNLRLMAKQYIQYADQLSLQAENSSSSSSTGNSQRLETRLQYYNTAAYYFDRAIMLDRSIDIDIESSLYLNAISTLDKAASASPGDSLDYSLAMKATVEHLELSTLSANWKNSESKRRLNEYMEKYQAILESNDNFVNRPEFH